MDKKQCNSCGKPKCSCKNKEFTKSVIEIDNPGCVTLFRKVIIPVSMGDDTTVPPAIGKYRNVLLVYEANKHVYLYSSDGIPTLLTSDVVQDLEQKIDAVADDLQIEITAREDADIALDDRLTTVEGIAATALQPEAIDKVVMTDISLNQNTSTTTVQIDGAKENLLTGATTTKNIPLPVASHTQAGIMNSSTFDAVTANSNNINALLNGAVAITGLSANPSQSDLTTAWETQTGLTTLMNRAGIYDVTNNKVWTYYSNDDTWYAASNTTQVTVNTFTNSSEGTILGSTNVGQIFAENDGTGSVNGWDALSGTVSTNTSNITSLQTAMAGKQDKLTAGANITISPTNVISASGTEYTAGNAITIENDTINADIYPADFFTNEATDTDTGSNITLDKTIPATLKSVELYGDTEQQAYSGKNILTGNYQAGTNRGIAHSWDNVFVTLSGTATSTYSDIVDQINMPLQEGTYTFSINKPVQFRVNIKITYGGNSYDAIIPAGDTSATVTIPSGVTDAILVRPYITVSVGTVVSDTFGMMLEVGSTATSFEPYVGGVPAPNPDYPQDVNVVTGEQTVTVTGKNLLKLDNNNVSPSNSARQGATVTINDNSIRFVATGTNSTQYAYCFTGELDPNKQYVLSGAVTKVAQTSTARVNYSYSDDGTTWAINATVFEQIPMPAGTTATFSQTLSGHKYYRFGVYNSFDATVIGTETYYYDIQIEEGSTATDYEPYQSQTYTVDLGSTELCELGDYQDYIYKSGDDWYVHKETNKHTFTGSENWYLQTSGTPSILYCGSGVLSDAINSAVKTQIYSDYFHYTTGAEAGGCYLYNRSVFVFYGDTTTTASTFKTWLGDNNTTVYYPLATPTDTQITDAGLIADLNALAGARSYLDVTNFNVTATGTNLPALLKPEVYAKSLHSIIELLNSFKNNLVVVLPNGMTTYPVGEAPLALDKALEAFQQGRSIFFVDYAAERTSIYTVSAVDANDGVWSMKVERIGANASETAGYWVIGTSNTTQWRRVDFYPNINITMQTTDPGEGQPLLANNFIAVYN